MILSQLKKGEVAFQVRRYYSSQANSINRMIHLALTSSLPARKENISFRTIKITPLFKLAKNYYRHGNF